MNLSDTHKDLYTKKATDNFMHAVRVIKMNKPTIAGKEMNTDKAICSILGVFPSTLSHIDKGRRSVTLEMIADICFHFGFSIQWMVFGTGNMYNTIEQPPTLEQRVRSIETKLNIMNPA